MEIDLAQLTALREELSWFPSEIPEALLSSLESEDHPHRLRAAQLQALFESHQMLLPAHLYTSVFSPLTDAFGWIQSAHLVSLLRKCLHKHERNSAEIAQDTALLVTTGAQAHIGLLPSIYSRDGDIEDFVSSTPVTKRANVVTPDLSCFRQKRKKQSVEEERPVTKYTSRTRNRVAELSHSSSFPALHAKASRPSLPECVVDVESGRRFLAAQGIDRIRMGAQQQLMSDKESKNSSKSLKLGRRKVNPLCNKEREVGEREEDVAKAVEDVLDGEEEVEHSEVIEKAAKRRRKRLKKRIGSKKKKEESSKNITNRTTAVRCAKFGGRLFVDKDVVRQMVEDQKKKLEEMKLVSRKQASKRKPRKEQKSS